jgi:MoaA/NifB/PqqE/SkfB family radical SAM enzyme
MPISDIKMILNDSLIEESSKYYGPKFDISLGGGEPFLVENLQQIVETIDNKFPGSFKSISTNGLYKERIIKFVRKNKRLKFKLNISVDGINEAHDRIRGICGAFEETMQTIIGIKKTNPQQKIELKLTLTPKNYNQIKKVYKLARKLNCDFAFKPAENIKSYTNRISDIGLKFTQKQLCSIRNEAFFISAQMYMKGNFRKAKFFKDIPFYLFSKKKPDKCFVLDNDITIMPDGKVHTCVKMAPLGNINEDVLKNLWHKRRIKFKKCPSCMLMCGSYKDYSDKRYEEKVANIETTLRCNLDCKMCTQRELRRQKSADMSLGTFKKVINNYPDITRVSFVGGEPFLNRDFFKMMNFLDRRAITYEITTNGTLINKKKVNQLKDCVRLEKINFSLDGAKDYHDSERGKGVFKKCIAALMMSDNFFNINVCTVMKQDNLEEIPKLTEYLANLGIRNQKIIYGMSLDKDTRKKSKEIEPYLRIQGPSMDNPAEYYQRISKLFKALEYLEKRKSIFMEFEPFFIRSNLKDFLDDKIICNQAISCKQINQYRFDTKGNRIICEFIRNKFNPKIVGYLNNNLLPICRRCCKLIIDTDKHIAHF